ncbi:hypothetical protein E2C01_050891 [Portunus trituberculatus]|uniref:Uncharacterized protein n=1 Tax=Portunus trituberculatus TaxID=210409 RepID=A0A5B7GK66_PORTR|nr:hypothetical protein [Portunus trituberculatus]
MPRVGLMVSYSFLVYVPPRKVPRDGYTREVARRSLQFSVKHKRTEGTTNGKGVQSTSSEVQLLMKDASRKAAGAGCVRCHMRGTGEENAISRHHRKPDLAARRRTLTARQSVLHLSHTAPATGRLESTPLHGSSAQRTEAKGRRRKAAAPQPTPPHDAPKSMYSVLHLDVHTIYSIYLSETVKGASRCVPPRLRPRLGNTVCGVKVRSPAPPAHRLHAFTSQIHVIRKYPAPVLGWDEAAVRRGTRHSAVWHFSSLA